MGRALTFRRSTEFTEVLSDVPDEQMSRALGEEIAELAAHIHAATYRLLVLLLEFDRRRGWDGWRSTAQWLCWRTGIGLEAAREKLRVARALAELPAISAAFAQGEISYSKVRAMTRIVTPDIEDGLLLIARHGTTSHVETVVRGLRRADPEREERRAEVQHEHRSLHTRLDAEGNVFIEGRLSPELGARFLKALDAAVDALDPADEGSGDPAGESRRESYPQRRADALVLLADSALAADLPGRRAVGTHQVVIHVDAEVLADPAADGRSELECGAHVSGETSRRLACDASVVEITEDASGTPLSVGRKRRTIPPAIRRALDSRDAGCRFPGCHHTRFLQAHHIEHWANGGETRLDNLVHVCSFHHRQLHEGGIRLERNGDRLEFRSRSGMPIAEAPAPPRPGSIRRLREEQRDLDIRVDRLPLWDGSPIDYGLAVSSLLQSAEGAQGTPQP